MKRRKFSEKNAVDRAFLTGFTLGHCLGRRERDQELRKELRSIEATLENEVEALSEQMRAEVEKTVAEFRKTWGMGPPDPDRSKVTVQ